MRVLALALILSAFSGPAADPPAPPLTVTVHQPGTAPGLLFLAPKGTPEPNGPAIYDDQGRLVWFHRIPLTDDVTDFRVQAYRGKPVLTWWQGRDLGIGRGEGEDVIADAAYRVIATVPAPAGEPHDLHEFQLTPQGTALVTAYRVVPGDVSSVGGAANGLISDSLAEEIDVATGKVLLRWSSLAHVPLTDSYARAEPDPLVPFDYFHINSIAPADDGNLLISGRNTSAVYEVDRHTGAILWRLGGRHSDFRPDQDATFNWQHDARPAGPDTIRLFDNENCFDPTGPESRVKWIKLDRRAGTAHLLRSLAHPQHLATAYEGSAQALPNGDTLVGWGHLGRVSEFSRAGALLFDAALPAGYETYRAYRFEWPAAGKGGLTQGS